MLIGELAAPADVTVRTLRHYHHIGLFPGPQIRERSRGIGGHDERPK